MEDQKNVLLVDSASELAPKVWLVGVGIADLVVLMTSVAYIRRRSCSKLGSLLISWSEFRSFDFSTSSVMNPDE